METLCRGQERKGRRNGATGKVLRIRIQNVDGIQVAEKAALQAMENAFPRQWRGIAAFEIIQKGSGNKEIDLVLITDERVIVVELKNWNGLIESDGEIWLLNGRRMGRSPVKVTQLKEKILASLIRNRLGARQTPRVDTRVVLCGKTTGIKLPEEEAAYVINLDEFLRIKEAAHYRKQFPIPAPNPPSGYIDKLDLFFASSAFRPREFIYQGFRQDGKPVFSHPDGVFREFNATNVEDVNARALMRRWNFGVLGVSAGTQRDRAVVALREGRVLSYVESRNDELAKSLLQPLTSSSQDEVTVDHCELFRLPRKHSRLSEFINRFGGKLSIEDRVDIVKALLLRFAELHDIQVAHRDIGDHCIWVERPNNVMLSGFLTAFFPEAETVGGMRELVRAGRARVPDDMLSDEKATPFTRDVFLLGAASHILLFGEPPSEESGIAVWRPRADKDPFRGRLDAWFGRSLEWPAAERFPDAREMLTALNAVDLGLKRSQAIKSEWFEPFRSSIRLQRKYPEEDVIKDHESSLVYKSSFEGVPVKVKAWWGVSPDEKRPDISLSLLRFLQSAHRLKTNPTMEMGEVLEFGFNPQGVFLVTKWVGGETFQEWLKRRAPISERVALSLALLDAVERIHALEMPHGDIHPGNIIVPEPSAARVVFIDSPDLRVGGGSAHNPKYSRPNAEQLPPDARDRYAAARLVQEALADLEGRAQDVDLSGVMDELRRTLDSDLSSPSLAPLRLELERARSKPEEEQLSHVVTVRSLERAGREGPVLSDNGDYYVSVRDDRKDPSQVITTITGVRTQIRLFMSAHEPTLKRFVVEPIGHQHLLRAIANAAGQFRGQIVIRKGDQDNADSLAAYLHETYVRKHLDESAKGETDASSKAAAHDDIPVKDIWRALIDAEEDALHTVVISGRAYAHPASSDILLVPYRIEEGVLDFDDFDEVSVLQETAAGEWARVGTLVLSETNRSVLAIGSRRLSLSTELGQVLRLRSKMEFASYAKRKAAVDRILGGRAVISNALAFLEPRASTMPYEVAAAPTDEQLDAYTRRDDTGRIIYALNEDQREAFKTLFRNGPIGLLQGPPGTGKTAFIGTFIHYAVAHGRAQSVLLVSQSHEAVNNAVEKALELSRQSGLDLDAVRIGARQMLSDSIAPIHPHAIQQQYRERFRAELRERITSLAPSLGLPADFIKEYITFQLTLGNLNREILSLEARFEAAAAEEKAGLRQRINARTDTLWSIAGTNYGRPRGIDPGRLCAEIEEHLIGRFSIASEDAVDRLRKLMLLSGEWIDVLGSTTGNFVEFLARTRVLVAGTCVGIGAWHAGVTANIYDWVIIDEAGRATPSELAVALQVGRRALLVGDHEQLPPMYEDAVKRAAARRLGTTKSPSLFVSDFERTFEVAAERGYGASLRTQYRMAPAIGSLVSDCFYPKPLKLGRGPSGPHFDALPAPFNSEVVWLDTSAAGGEANEQRSEDKTDAWNNYEARTVLHAVKVILLSGTFLADLSSQLQEDEIPVGIICMYAAQCRRVERLLADSDWLGENRRLIKVDTVDGYQGKENRIVIVSLVRNNKFQDQGFLHAKYRANVAMSRAMDRLIIVGAARMWRGKNKSAPLGRVLSHIEQNNATQSVSLASAKDVLSMEISV